MEILEIFRLLFPPIENSEIQLYIQSARQLLSGSLPYQDFLWIYSPGLLLFLTILVWIGGSELGFVLFYELVLVFSWTGLWWVIYKYAVVRLSVSKPLLQLISSLSFIFLGLTVNKLFINTDVLGAFLSTLGLLALLKDKSKAGAAWLGLSTAIRPFALVWWPLVFLHQKSWQAGLRAMAILGLPTLLSFVPFGLYKLIPEYFHSLIFQSQRSVEIESVPASLMWLISSFGFRITSDVTILHQAITLHWLPDNFILNKLVLLVLSIPLVWTIGWLAASWRSQKSDNYRLLGLASLLIIGLLTFHPVMSPQYLIWLWSPLALWLVEGIYRKRLTVSYALGIWIIILVIHGLTSAILMFYAPANLPVLINMEFKPMFLILLRNCLLASLWLGVKYKI